MVVLGGGAPRDGGVGALGSPGLRLAGGVAPSASRWQIRLNLVPGFQFFGWVQQSLRLLCRAHGFVGSVFDFSSSFVWGLLVAAALRGRGLRAGPCA